MVLTDFGEGVDIEEVEGLAVASGDGTGTGEQNSRCCSSW